MYGRYVFGLFMMYNMRGLIDIF